MSDDEADIDDRAPIFEADEELDDPVLTEIPIIMKPKNNSDNLYVLQYPGRPPYRQFVGDSRVLETRFKPSTELIEVDVPIATEQFFDEKKSIKWGGIQKQTLSGVLSSLDGYYAARVQDGELVLIPVDSVAQMRPNLSYIDKEAQTNRESNRLDQPQNNTVQVVQMTVKGTNDTAPRLGGALMAKKKVDETEYNSLPWVDLTEENATRAREDLLKVTNKNILVSNATEEDYLGLLVKDTIVDPNPLK